MRPQGPIDSNTNQFNTGSIEEQTKQVLDSLEAVLKASSLSMVNVVSTTVYMKDVNDFSKMNAVYGSYFTDAPPARAAVQVTRLPRDAQINISAVAYE